MIKKLLSLITLNDTKPDEACDNSLKLAAISLLIQVAKADHELSAIELTKLTELVGKHFNDHQNVNHAELIELAMERSDASTSLYEFTTLINSQYSMDQKFQLITLMWQIAFSDNVLDRFEEHLIRRVADLIYLPHMKFIEAKHIADNK